MVREYDDRSVGGGGGGGETGMEAETDRYAFCCDELDMFVADR